MTQSLPMSRGGIALRSLFSSRVLRRLAVLVGVCSVALSGVAQAQAMSEADEAAARIKMAQTLGPLGPNLFGDTVNMSTGEVTFATTDVSLPGNNGLSVALGRRWTVTGRSTEVRNGTLQLAGLMGSWDADLPYLKGIFAASTGWQVSGAAPNNRCSGGFGPPSVNGSLGVWGAAQYWRGNTLNVPGSGEQALLLSSTGPRPTDGQTSVLITEQNWQFRCLPQLANAGADPQFNGEGFLALTPDGTKYYFDWMTRRAAAPSARNNFPIQGQPASVDQLLRVEVRLYATRVEDRFGNVVNYTWSGDRLTAITASDGRQITLGYDANNRITSATANGRVWTYTYDSGGTLLRVELPDHSAWQYTLSSVSSPRYLLRPSGAYKPCDTPDVLDPAIQTAVSTVVHPSGAVGTFTMTATRHGRANISNECVVSGTSEGDPQNPYTHPYYGPPREMVLSSLTQKTITGPGLTPATWTMAYNAPAADLIQYGGAGPITKTVTVTNPDQTANRYTFGTRWYIDEGLMLRAEALSATGVRLRDEVDTYAINPVNPPYPYAIGNAGGYPDNFTGTYRVPRTQTVVSQNGDTFTSTVNSFDAYARPVSMTQSSSLGSSRTDTTTRYDDTTRWVLGQVRSVTNTNTGKVMMAMDFDAATALPIRVYKFGLLAMTLTYNADGTLASMANGLGNTVRMSNWKRGVPQLITNPDQTTRSAVVDNNGWVTSVTDERGSSTQYGYDVLGRSTSLTYPTADTVAWTGATMSYTQLAAAELGVPSGAWRVRMNQGNHQVSMYLDARYNPILSEDRDLSTGSARYQRNSYDVMGRVVFQAYPSAIATASVGTTMEYDALGRMTRQLTTDGITLGQIAYLAGNRMQATDADGRITTTSFQAFGSPAYDNALVISAPEGQTTTMARDVFGMIQSVTQSGGGASLTRSTSYDAYYRPCKTLDPEGGATLNGFDAAGQMIWQARGQASTAACTTTAPVGAITMTYDTRGRPTLLHYPDATGDVSTTYDAVGNRLSVSNPTATWTYTYNKRNLLEGEQLVIDGRYLQLTHTYNALGNLQSYSYPDTLRVDYAPNAFGEATQANTTCCSNGTPIASIASGLQYYPNGQIARYTTGNGLTFSQTLNARQRPETLQLKNGVGTTLQSLTYGYSAAGDVTWILDGVDGADTVNNLTYDGLHRLKTANGIWGSYSYTYDGLNNLISRTGTNPLSYGYDTVTNRLSSVAGLAAPPAAPAPPAPAPAPSPAPSPNPKPIDPCSGFGCTPPATTASFSNLSGATAVTQTITAATRTYSYNSRGAMVSDGIRSFTLNANDQITNITGIATYGYDGNGKRVKTTKADGSIEYAIYDQSGALVSHALVTAGQNNNYVQLDGRTIAEVLNGVPTWLHSDLLGSPRLATTGSGSIAWREHYGPYGEKLNGVNDKIGYTGHAYDAESQLTYAQARFYDPAVGRFMSMDPIGFTGNPASFTRYAYANNNPFVYTDPTGMCAVSLSGCDGGANNFELSADGSSKDESMEMAEMMMAMMMGMGAGAATSGGGKPNGNSGSSSTNSLDQTQLTNVIYNETSSLSPAPNAKSGQPGSAEDLHDGRVAVGEIAASVVKSGHIERVLASTALSDREAQAIADQVPAAVAAYSDAQSAAREVLAGSNTTNGATQYRTRNNKNFTTNLGRSGTSPGTPISQHFGPFRAPTKSGVAIIIVAP